MKKFLSLVLALVMTMSLVTISAGATEYKDLTDKDEIQYEEAVAVLNRIGIITGYEDGSFRPETKLTRGAAAKIIVSLMIGPDAAAALPNDASPYPDVPAGHAFAGVIGYCKTAGYISGYGDGTFKPTDSLTGYAFAKMLLGAVGYKSDIEGFTGTGWTMNVARIGNEAHLFNRLDFVGADAVTRDAACQLALNTLKATMVEYTGGVNINTASGDTMTVNPTRTYKTSNQSYAANISNRKLDTQGNAVANNHYTVEFGEEHFKDLRLNDEHVSARDSFGRPSNEWSYKKVTIGVFPIAADFTFDKQMAYADKTDAVKNRATGLGSYDLSGVDKDGNDATTSFWVNGVEHTLTKSGTSITWTNDDFAKTNDTDLIAADKTAKVSNICDLTDNGTVVEVYVSEDDADFITDVVVVKSQLMEVKKIGSDYVSLEKNDPDDGKKDFPGFNQDPIDVKVGNVQAEDVAYSALKDLKAGDNVVVIPVAVDHDKTEFEVAEAYEPETVSGALTGVKDYGPTNKNKNAVSLTVGGTEYSISLWNKDMSEIDGDKIKVTKKDVTLTLDKHGYALLAEDVGATNDWMVVGSFRSSVENGRIVTTVTGWDISGEAVELNLGPNYDKNTSGVRPGDLVKYESTSQSNLYDWTISETKGVYNVYTGEDETTDVDGNGAHAPYRIKASNVKVDLMDYPADDALFIDKGVKFIYVTFDVDGEVESIQVKSGVQAVENAELRQTYTDKIPYQADGEVDKDINGYNSAQAAVTDKGAIKAVVIKQESNDADSASMLYIRDMPGGAHYDANGKMVYAYTVAMNGKDGLVDDEMTIYSYDRLYRGDFASYAKTEHAEYDEFYTLRQRNNFIQRTTSTLQADIMDIVNVNASLVKLASYGKVGSGDAFDDGLMPNISTAQKGSLGIGDQEDIVSLRNAVFVDLTKNDIDSFDDLKDYMYTKPNGDDSKWRMNTVEAQLVVNDNAGNDGFRKVSMVIITDVTAAEDTSTANKKMLTGATIGDQKSADNDFVIPAGGTEAAPSNTAITDLTEAVAKDAVIRFAFEGDDLEIKLNDSDIKNGSSHKLEEDDVIKVTVIDLNGDKAVWTFTIGALTPTTYSNTTVTGLGLTDVSYVEADWTDGDDVTLTGTTFDLPFLRTGDADMDMAQVKEAAAFYSETHPDDPEMGEPQLIGGQYVIMMGSIPVTFDPSSSMMLVYTKANTADATAAVGKIVAANTKVSASGGAGALFDSASAKAIGDLFNDTMTYVATPTSANVEPGHTYVDKAFAVVQTLPTNDGAQLALFDVTYSVAANDALAEGTEITITATARAEITLSTYTTTPVSITAASAVKEIKFNGTDATVVNGDPTTTVINFVNAADKKILEGETVTLKLEVEASHLAAGTITLPKITVAGTA